MKNPTLFVAGLILCSTGAFAQGTIVFNNDDNTLVLTNDGVSSTFASAPVNAGYEVQLFYQPGSNPTPSNPIFFPTGPSGSWKPMNNAPVVEVTGSPGRFFGGVETTGSDVLPGGNAWFTVVSWYGGWSNPQSALAAGEIISSSTIFELTTGSDGSIAVPLTASTSADGFVSGIPFRGEYLDLGSVPEPSPIVLGGLGTAVLLFSRRRKSRYTVS
jgi:hypothetical protein